MKSNYGYATVDGSDKQHKIIDIIDSGRPAHEVGGGNHYLLEHPDTGKRSKIHQSKIKHITFDKMSKIEQLENKLKLIKKIIENKPELITEHKRLVDILRSGSNKSRNAEASRQKKELDEMSKDELDDLKSKHRLPKEPTNAQLVDRVKRKYQEPKPKSFPDKVEEVRYKNTYVIKSNKEIHADYLMLKTQLAKRQPTDAEINFIFNYEKDIFDKSHSKTQEDAAEENYRRQLEMP